MAKIKRSQFSFYLNTTPEYPHVLGSASATYALMNAGVPDASEDMNPENTEETNIAEDTASITVDSYAPTLPVEQTAMSDDPIFLFIFQLWLDRAVLGRAETDICICREYETGFPATTPAQQQKVAIAIEDLGDEGGAPGKINYTINYVGNPAVGTFNTSSPAFTATP
jgi:hypothetical protein